MIKQKNKELRLGKASNKYVHHLLQNAVVGFFTGIYNWLIEIVTGVGKIAMALISFVFTAIGSAIFATLKLCLDKLVDWVMKW